MHVACDALGRPLALMVTGGNTNDCTQFTTVMEAVRVPRIGPGRPRTRPPHIIGDKGHSQGDAHLAAAAGHRSHHPRAGRPDPQPPQARQPRRPAPGLRPADLQNKRRNVVERCFNRLKQWGGIATRYDKIAESYQAAVTLASVLMRCDI
ncbi:transposase [Streptomyces bullii]|uniref:Transposase n=1 Tax=Streptomyces bullii TaxID=349910 RepID=A0ABW0UVS9_9ACTN